MSEINQNQRAAFGWDVLIQVSKNKELIRYNQLGSQIGIHHRAVRFVLGLIQNYCLENQLPPLTILVVNDSGLPGEGFIAWDVDNIDQGLQQVYDYNWSNIENPFNYAKDGLTENEIINELLDNPDNSEDIYSKIKVRGIAQSIFRKTLLVAYESKCAFCGLSFKTALQASHIISWSNSKKAERLDIRNGILLCSIHHKLFDDHWFTINDTYTIIYDDPNEKEGNYSEYDKLMTTALHNTKMTLPTNKNHRPKKSFLKQHKEGF
jgi:putative restriction endonuclease